MRVRSVRGVLAVIIAAAAAACSSGAAQPAAVIGVPAPISPAANTSVGVSAQVILTASNAISSGATALTYTFEVATDAGFANKVQTKDVAQGNGQTSVALDPGLSAREYFWHVRASGGGTTGLFCDPVRFSVVNITAPTPLSPSNGATIAGWPTLIVGNVTRPGGGSPLSYRFEIAMDNAFSAIIASGTVGETPTQTTFTPTANLPGTLTTVFWRATAFDASGTQSPPSPTQSFALDPSAAARIAAQEGIVLWPGQQPTGTSGHARLGDSWNVQTVISVSGVVHQTPTLDELRLFDLMDRGFSPQGAIDFINSHGYFTNAAYYPGPDVLGLDFEYMARRAGSQTWDLVFKVE